MANPIDPKFIEFRHETVSRVGGVLAVCAAVVAYFASPILHLYNPFMLFYAGLLLSFGIVATWVGAVLAEGKWVNVLMIGGLLESFAVLVCMSVYSSAQIEPLARKIDLQCEMLEVDMLQLYPARKDSRELFGTLGCRPQGRGVLKLPSSHYKVVGGNISRATTIERIQPAGLSNHPGSP